MEFSYAQLRIFQVTEASLKKAISVHDIPTEPVHYIMNPVYSKHHHYQYSIFTINRIWLIYFWTSAASCKANTWKITSFSNLPLSSPTLNKNREKNKKQTCQQQQELTSSCLQHSRTHIHNLFFVATNLRVPSDTYRSCQAYWSQSSNLLNSGTQPWKVIEVAHAAKALFFGNNGLQHNVKLTLSCVKVL